MLRRLISILFITTLLYSCGASKKVNTKPLMSSTYDAQKFKDSLNKVVDSVVARIDTIVKANQTEQLKSALTPEELLAEQKRTGINKGANWASAMHYDLRKPNYVIIHHTSQNSTAQTVRTFQVPHSKVSAHYVIGRDGQLIQMLNDYDRAWHAGKSKWGSVTDMNSMSIGIELDNNGREPFPDPQINTLLILLDTLKTKYLIPQLNFIGHGDIAPTRKDDPNVFFPWKLLAQRGFGIWYNEDFLMDPPANFNPIDALKIMGYDMTNPESAIRAFKRKFIVNEVNGTLSAYDKRVLYDLYRKFY